MIPNAVQLRWSKRLPESTEHRIANFCRQWEGTPWVQGQRARRVGVDCVQLAAAFLDAMFRTPEHLETVVPVLPANCAVNRPETALPTIRALKTAHFGADELEQGPVEPGDLIVVRSEVSPRAADRMAHIVIASVIPRVVLSATPASGVRLTSLAAFTGAIRLYRPREKHRWQ